VKSNTLKIQITDVTVVCDTKKKLLWHIPISRYFSINFDHYLCCASMLSVHLHKYVN